MLILRQSTAIDIRMGPFVDATNGVTPEIGITLGAADQAEVLKENGAATVTMAGVFAAITGADGWYDYTVASGDVDTVGEVVFVVQDESVCLPVYVRAFIVEEAVYDALYDATSAGPLQGTTPGNTLDVNATGEAGIDWANIGSPTTAQNLSGTNIDVDQIVASVSGAVGSVTGAVGSVTAAVTVGTINANVITATSINAAAFTAAKFATDAIDANALASDAVDKIRDAIMPTQNAVFNNIEFLFVAASDGRTPVTGATGTATTRSIDGGSFGAGTGTLAEVGNGIYQYDASAADMNGGIITFRFVGTGGTPGAPDDRFITIVTGGGV